MIWMNLETSVFLDMKNQYENSQNDRILIKPQGTWEEESRKRGELDKII